MKTYGIDVPDQQLACAPVTSPDGRAYLGAMAAAANYGRANRQLLTEATRRAFERAVGHGELDLLYDVSHNLAKLEWHEIGGGRRLLCVHRKGATRALPPRHPDLPADLRDTGQPVLIPGSMGTASYVLVGAGSGGAFHSTCHGAGRTMSRHAARKRIRGAALSAELEAAGSASVRGLRARLPRKPRSRTRTSTTSLPPVSGQGSPDVSRGSDRSVSSRPDGGDQTSTSTWQCHSPCRRSNSRSDRDTALGSAPIASRPSDGVVARNPVTLPSASSSELDTDGDLAECLDDEDDLLEQQDEHILVVDPDQRHRNAVARLDVLEVGERSHQPERRLFEAGDPVLPHASRITSAMCGARRCPAAVPD